MSVIARARGTGRALAPAARIARHFRGAAAWHGLPAVSLLGPRFSGRSECLTEVRSLLDKRRNDATSAVPILIDLESLGRASDETLAERFVSELGLRRGMSRTTSGEAEDAGGYITQCLKRIGGLEDRGTVILLDHLDAVSAGFARTVVRSFRVAFDQRDVFAAYRRVGVVFAGSASLSMLRRSGESAFVTDFLAMPSTSSALRLAGVRKHWPGSTSGWSRAAEERVAWLSGGERPFVELIVDALGAAAAQTDPDLEDIDRAATRICQELSSDIFRELALALLLDPDLWTLAVEVLQRGDGQVARRDVASDVDVFSLSGVLVLANQGDASTRYAFRNELVRRFVACVHAWRENGHRPPPAPSIIEAAGTIDGLWHALGSGPRFWHAARALGDLWALLTGSRIAPDDIHVRVALHEPATPVYWLSARTMTVIDDRAFRPPPVLSSAVRGIDEYGVGVPCVATDSAQVSVAVATTDDHARLAIVVTHAAPPALRLREHTLSLWQRAVEIWSRVLAMSALAELARHVLADRERSGISITDDRMTGRDGSDGSPGRARLDLPTLRRLSQRLAEVGFALGRPPNEFVAALLGDADLPEAWKREIGGRTYGSIDDAARYVIRQLVEKGTVPGSPAYSALAVVLCGAASRFGREDRELFRDVVVRLRNEHDAALLQAMAQEDSDAR
jgi:hypothetical protein